MNILIADDHQLVREGLKLLISQFGGAPQFLEAHDYPSLRAQLLDHPAVDVVVADLNMPGANQGGGLEQALGVRPDVPFVVVSALSSVEVVRKVLAWPSVYAFVPKNGSPGHMQRALQAAVARHKIGELHDVGQQAPVSADEGLPPRMAAVRALLREGKSNKVIAYELGLSEGTVKNYMSEIFKMLKVTNRTQAARSDEPFRI